MTEQQLCEHFVKTVETDLDNLRERLTELSCSEDTYFECTALFEEYREYLNPDDIHEVMCINAETGDINVYVIESDYE